MYGPLYMDTRYVCLQNSQGINGSRQDPIRTYKRIYQPVAPAVVFVSPAFLIQVLPGRGQEGLGLAWASYRDIGIKNNLPNNRASYRDIGIKNNLHVE